MPTLNSAVVKTAHAGLTWDDRVRGFGLRVHPGGSKSFFLNYRVDGREHRKAIGRWPEWSVDAARAEAKELRKRIDRGDNPAVGKSERRDAPTIQDLVDRYIAEHLPTKSAKAKDAEHLKKKAEYRENDEKRMLTEIAKRLGKHTKVADVHDGDIKHMHQGITATGRPGRANRILAIA